MMVFTVSANMLYSRYLIIGFISAYITIIVIQKIFNKG